MILPLFQIFTNFLHSEGFTLGVEDILVTDPANGERKQIIKDTRELGKDLSDVVGLNVTH